MTRNVVLSFIHNLTASKKSDQLQASSSKKNHDVCIDDAVETSLPTKIEYEINDDKMIINGKSLKKKPTKRKFFLRKSRSSNSVQSPSTEITSTKRPEPLNLVSTDIASNHTTSNKYDKIIPSSGNDKHKRKSMSDVVIVRGKVTTYSSIKNDLSVNQNSIAAKSNDMPSLITKSNGSAGLTQITTAVNNNPTQDVHLQPKPINVSTNLSSNSSLNSSSVKSTTSKSNDGTSTEKKPKSTSRSRQKKFHRHFKQVAIDEEVINFFSCAFVSDILLQGYLYITKNYVAFYSNVFGYVTKLLIPIKSVTKISKEKTVKIIPNAIAVVTSDERLVFSNFLSRESAFQLMIQVWKDAMPNSGIDVSNASAQLRICSLDTNPMDSADTKPIFEKVTPKHLLQVVATRDLDGSEMDDDSSSALSGNECLTQILSNTTKTNEPPDVSSSSSVCNNFDKETPNCDRISTNRESASDFDSSPRKVEADSVMSEAPATPEAPAKALDQSTINFMTFKLPRTIHIAYFGLLLVIILTLIAIFLFYRIVEMKNSRMRSYSTDDLKSDSMPSLEQLAEILKWQKDIQDHRVHLTKNVLANNLEQISQISDNLQTLSNLIHTKEENTDFNDKLSTIMGECNSNIESCSIDQTSPNNQ